MRIVQHTEDIAYNSNCSGPECKAGKQRYWTARREAIQAGRATVKHHGVGGYRQGCRCEICRDAMRVRNADLRHRADSPHDNRA
jgi:hypothetical protein